MGLAAFFHSSLSLLRPAMSGLARLFGPLNLLQVILPTEIFFCRLTRRPHGDQMKTCHIYLVPQSFPSDSAQHSFTATNKFSFFSIPSYNGPGFLFCSRNGSARNKASRGGARRVFFDTTSPLSTRIESPSSTPLHCRQNTKR